MLTPIPNLSFDAYIRRASHFSEDRDFTLKQFVEDAKKFDLVVLKDAQ